MTSFSKPSHRDTVRFVTLPFNTSIISFWHPIFDKLAFLGAEYIVSPQSMKHNIFSYRQA